jgi:very-short-patch-repair endonuclease
MKPVWTEHELVAKHHAMALVEAGKSAERAMGFHVVNWVDESRKPLESPIEAVFSLWWRALSLSGLPLFLHPQEDVSVFTDTGRRNYRLDFAVVPDGPLPTSIGDPLGIHFKFAVELDGHEFHERTREQVALRNRRDRDLQAGGWKVYHVSGSELVANPRDVVQSVQSAAHGEYWRYENAIAKALTGKIIHNYLV